MELEKPASTHVWFQWRLFTNQGDNLVLIINLNKNCCSCFHFDNVLSPLRNLQGSQARVVAIFILHVTNILFYLLKSIES